MMSEKPPRSGARWTDREMNYLRGYYWQLGKKCSKHLGRSPAAVKIMAIRLGLTVGPKEYFTTVELGTIIGVHHNRIQTYVDAFGLAEVHQCKGKARWIRPEKADIVIRYFPNTPPGKKEVRKRYKKTPQPFPESGIVGLD